MPEFITKASGVRHDYDSGMRRDTQEGKARHDLLWPVGVPYDEQFLTRAAMLMTRGAGKYGLRNWEKANSPEELERFKGSALRHLMQYITGETDEDHAAAVLFNVLAAVTTEWRISCQASTSAPGPRSRASIVRWLSRKRSTARTRRSASSS